MQKRRRFSVAVCLGLMLIAIGGIAGSFARAQSADLPTTQPLTTQPNEELAADSPIRKWFVELADSDPQTRDQARENLMGISGDDLPKLRQLVIESQPLSPDQTAALHDIVIQAYLASQKYEVSTDPNSTDGKFFLGLLWGIDLDTDLRLGVSVEERIPGFPSYRFLRTGDMILGIYINPDAPLAQFPNMETHNRQTLIQAIAGSPRAQNIALQVLRNGEVLKIPLTMAPRPLYADPRNIGALRMMMSNRANDADRYWNENFVPLLEQVANSD